MFCTCSKDHADEVHDLYSDEMKKLKKNDFLQIISWTLFRRMHEMEKFIDGMIVFPKQNLTDILTEDVVLATLNNQDPFDFEFKPQNNDELVLRSGELFNRRGKKIDRHRNSEFAFFVYQDGMWSSRTSPSEYDEINVVRKGLVKIKL